ncbi:hypothetical protein Tco_0916617, partial [Tanacetum coccineum]
RKAHLLGDKQIPNVRKTFGGNTRDLGTILEENGQDCKWTQRRHEDLFTEVETASRFIATPSGFASDDVRT